MLPVLVSRLTPAPPDNVEVVLPKFRTAVDVPTLMATPVAFVIVVVGLLRLPATPVKLMPVVALLVDEILPKVAVSAPVVRFRAWPVPFSVTSEMVMAPKPVPLISVVEFPPVNPVNMFPDATVIAFPVVMLTIVPFALFVVGKGSLPLGGVIPVIAERLAVASWPMKRCPLSKVTGPA